MLLQAQPQALPETPDISAVSIGNRVIWKSSALGKGRGVHAVVDIAQGEVIEQSPVTIIPKSETNLIENGADGQDSIIDQYLLRWQPDVKGQEYCLGHGYLMVYNHSKSPNGALQHDFEAQTISMIAAQPIRAGEEITFNYDCEIWFEIVE